jgi:hypothetical protein
MGDIGKPRKIIQIPIPQKIDMPEPAPAETEPIKREEPILVPA